MCIVSGGGYNHNPYNCQLVIGGGRYEQTPDTPVPDWRLPACGRWITATEGRQSMGNSAAVWRVFGDRCHHRASEQWTSLTRPSIGIWHPFRNRSSDEFAEDAARTARVLGSPARRTDNDLGFVRGVRVYAGHAIVRIDHVVATLDGRLMNPVPATVGYRLLTPTSVTTGQLSCVHYVSSCTAAQLRAQFRKGRHPADGTRPLAGRLVRVVIFPGEHRMTIFDGRRERFVSYGDRGCGC
ncbi:MAG: hypothetical protein ACRDVG_15790 [Jatrophihabitantaceae bacterium]